MSHGRDEFFQKDLSRQLIYECHHHRVSNIEWRKKGYSVDRIDDDVKSAPMLVQRPKEPGGLEVDRETVSFADDLDSISDFFVS